MNFHDLDQSAHTPDPALQRYWQRTCRLTAWLLGLWGLVGFGLTYFARSLSFSFFGWPFGFWVAAQGALLVFCGLIAFYAYAMRKLDENSRHD